jgi:hypothetical protein
MPPGWGENRQIIRIVIANRAKYIKLLSDIKTWGSKIIEGIDFDKQDLITE